MERRKFIKTAGYTAAAGYIAAPLTGSAIDSLKVGDQPKQASVVVRENKVFVDTFTLTATIEKGIITSLKSKITGEEFIEKPDITTFRALKLLYSDDLVNVNEEKFGKTETYQVSNLRAETIFHCWDGDGVLTISADPENGDLMIEPSAYSSRPGVLACRWCLTGLKSGLEIIAPLFQGARLKLDDPLLKNSRWSWPQMWEAGFAVLQSAGGGLWLHCRDTGYRFKALVTGQDNDACTIGLDSEASGPIDNNLSAGGICWRLNVYQGDWQKPAGEYRQWYYKAYNLGKEESSRQSWINDIRLAVSWCPGRTDILDALAKKISPKRIVLHFNNWRTFPYDENYPDYHASESAKEFIKKCNDVGFHVMPHFNSIDMDPGNPVFEQMRDFVYRSPDTKQLQGWSWYKGQAIGVPESNLNRLNGRDKKVMVKIHPGLSMWRSVLGRNILQASSELSLDSVFLDVCLCIWNIHNCTVESMNPAEGMDKLIRHVAGLGKGLVVGGEGLNEITAQGLSFGQVHLFKSWQSNIEGVERTGGCPVNDFLFGKLCRTFGYNGLGGRNKNEELRMQLHVDHNAIPTITVRSAEEILNPNQAVKKMMELAG
jgi:hypothetical protein